MKDVDNNLKQIQYELSRLYQEDSPCRGLQNVSIIVHKKKVKKRKKYDVLKYCHQPTITFRLSRPCTNRNRKLLKKHSSMPVINKQLKLVKQRSRSSDAILKKNNYCFNSKFGVNRMLLSNYHFNENLTVNTLSPFTYPTQKKWKVYRCQLGNVDDSCCCSCNSDAMFEVMKSLYDCYKKKNCDNCDCILCGHLPREERHLGEIRKSLTSIGLVASTKERKAKVKKAEKAIRGKTEVEKEKILKELAQKGEPLPVGKTTSEKALIKKIRSELGLPPEPKTAEEKARLRKAETAGVITPLEGKTESQKEKILKAQAKLGVPLPKGRTASEKALIQKVKTAAGIPEDITPEKLQKAKTTGPLTPLAGKSPEQREKILRGLAMQGLSLPEGKTASEKKLIDKVRVELGLPPDPASPSMRDKHAKAAEAGLLQPLEGKSPREQERILQGLHDMGIPLPEGRTASEKAIIAKVKARPREFTAKAVRMPSEKLRAAKAAGLLTPLEGKTASQKEKILRGQAEIGLPLPAGRTTSEKAIIAKIKASTVPSITTEKLRKAKAAGLLTPLDAKTTAEKEKILKGLAKSGLPLPEGKTASEKLLIKKIKADLGIREISPSEKVRKAKTAGLLTPLEGKTHLQKERILRGRAAAGLPLPVGKTPSERALIQKIIKDTGYVTPTRSEIMKKAKAGGLLTPLEGKTPSIKEKILRDRLAAGVPIAEGKTPSEKEIIKKVTAGEPPALKQPSEKLRQAKAAGALTPLEGKTPEHKEKILRGLVKAGLPLPEPKTASEKDLIAKVRQEFGLPPEAKTPSLKEKYRKAQAAGIITPLEGKTRSEKEKILKRLHDAGIALPEERTPSEKSMIKRIKAERKIPSQKIKAAEAAGLLTPLEGKTTAQKEKIFKGLAKSGMPLPEPKTESEKKIIRSVRREMGLPPEPKTSSEREKMRKLQAAGIITPLQGKTPSQKERILRGMGEASIPLPEGRTASERALIKKVQAEVGRPPSRPISRRRLGPPALPPKEREKLDKRTAKVMKEGKGPSDECICSLLTPEKEEVPTRIPSEKIRKAKAAGLLTPLEGKTASQKEKILKGLAKQGLPLPEAKTASEKKITDKVRKELGLPPEPKTHSMKEKYEKAAAAGVLVPLEGLSPAEKERVLKAQTDLGIPLPEGRTASEKALIAKVKAETKAIPSKIPSEKIRKAKAAGLLTPLEGKTAPQKEKILKGLAKEGLPLPEAKTASDKIITDKVRKELGLPPEPKTHSMKEKYEKAAAAGVLVPLEGLSPAEKERVLRAQTDLGIPLPEGRTASEKALIAKVKAETKAIPSKIPSEKIRKAKAAGLLTPLEGKTASQKEKILKGLAKQGLPLPEAKTASEKIITDKVRKELGLPPEPKTRSMKEKYEKAAAVGVLVPLEGLSPAEKERVLKAQTDLGIPLPEGRTASEKALIAKVKAETKAIPSKIPSEKIRKAKAAGLLTPLEGKTASQKEKILKGLAKQGLPLPEAKTASEKKITDKVRKELGLPPEPETHSMKEKYEKAAAAGVLVPLEGLSPAERERVLKAQTDLGIPLPEGRTASEKALIAKVKAETKAIPPKIPSEKIRKAKAAGLLTPLEGKTAPQKEKILKGLAKHGLPLPEAKTASDKIITDKVRKELGLPPEPKTRSMKEKYEKAAAAGVLVPLEGLSPAEKERVLRAQTDLGIPLPEGRTASEKALIAKVKAETKAIPPKIPSEKIRKAKAAGLLTPLEGKTASQKEKILKGLAKQGLPLPEAKTASEKKITDKVRKELGLPPEPETHSMKEKYEKAAAAGVLVPLEGLSPVEKERVLKAQTDLGIPLPEGRTASEKALIAKVKAETKAIPPKIPSEKIRKAKAAGLLTPLEGKTAPQKEKILKGLAKHGLPLPEAKTASDKIITDKVRKELGLPPEPKTHSMKEKYEKAAAAGVLVPLEGLSPAEKERVLRAQTDLGIPLPEGRTASEKALIAKVKAETKAIPSKIPSEKIRKAKAAGLLTPLEGKTASQKEKILKGLAKQGLPLPEAKTASEKKITDKVRKEFGLPPEPETHSMKEKYEKAAAAGVLVPLEGLSPAEKERVLKAQTDLGIPLPEGRTASERALIKKVQAEVGRPPSRPISRRRLGPPALPPKEREKLDERTAKVMKEGKGPSDECICSLLTPEKEEVPTRIPSEKIRKAKAAGLLTPLAGKTASQKEKILKGLAKQGLPLPEAKTASEKALIAKVKAETKAIPPKIPSEKIRKAKAAGLLTPLEGKTASQKEKILKGLAKQGLPLPEPKTASEKKITDKVRKELGLPPEPETHSMKEKYEIAAAAGVLVPLEGLSPAEKERVLKAQTDLGIPLPEGRTASEKALIAKVKAETKAIPSKIPSEKIRKAKAAGLLTPLEGKTASQKEKILKGLAKQGLPLPEAKTASDKIITDKVRKELGLPPEPKTHSMKEKYEKAAAAGVLVPLEGLSPAEKERVLRAQTDLGIPLPEGRTASEKDLIVKIKAEQEVSKVSSEKLRKAKVAGLLTPLEGKTKAQKEKIVKELAKAGIPLPEGKTPSEKALIHKVRTELGKPPLAKTPSEKAIVHKAKKEGLFTPLKGKSVEEKERILKGLAEAGLPLPKGKTASEKKLVKKVRTAAGLPPEPTPSEMRGEIKLKSKKIGVTPSKRLVKGVGAITKSKAGISEEYEDIIKTTTCDRGCGCDKKKIRFKHSYVKIRVTSPDISSLCPCPDECIPGVKAGAFIDNEGIKVTVGRVDGVTSYTSQFSNPTLKPPKKFITLYHKTLTNSFSSNSSIGTVNPSFDNTYASNDSQNIIYDDVCPPQRCPNNEDKVNYDLNTILTYPSDSCDSHTSLKSYDVESDKPTTAYLYDSTSPYEKCTDESDRFIDTSRYLGPSGEIFRNPASISCSSNYYATMEKSSYGSFDSILFIKSKSSLSLYTSSSSNTDVISAISFSNSSCVSSSTHYLYCPTSNDHFSGSTVEDEEIDHTESYYSGDDTMTSESSNLVYEVRYNRTCARNVTNGTVFERRKLNDHLTFRLSQTRISEAHNVKPNNSRKTNNEEPLIVINNLDSEHDITTMVDQLLSKNEFSDVSSIFVVVPTSDNNDSDSLSSSLSSTICIQLSEHYSTWNQNQSHVANSRVIAPRRNSSTVCGLKISAKGKKFCMEGMQETVASFQNKENVASFHNKETVVSFHNKENMFNNKLSKFCKRTDKTKNKLCQLSTPKEMLRNVYHGVSTDTTADRPCCCSPKKNTEIKLNQNSNHRCITNVVSELVTPLLVKQDLNCDKYRIPKISFNEQASFMSINRPPTPVLSCYIPPCTGHRGCHHPLDMDPIALRTPMPIPVSQVRKSPAQKPQQCQCSPEKIKGLLQQALKPGKSLNMKSIGCGGATNANKLPIPIIGLQAPNITGFEAEDDCSACSHHKYKDGLKMKCACSGKKKNVKLQPLCPCEQHQPPVSKTIVGPKAGTRSMGFQCCVCDDSKVPGGSWLKGRRGKPGKGALMGQLEVIGPSGGLALIERGGTYTQAGMRQLRNSTSTETFNTPKKDCMCKGKRGKKKKNVICECPPIEPEPEEDLNLLLAYSYDDYQRHHSMEQKQAMKQRSDMTQTYSGFKMFKKKKPPPEPQAEFTIEDAVRYYAAMNPDLLKDLVPPCSQESCKGTDYKDCACKDEKPKPDVKCACPFDETYDPNAGEYQEEPPIEDQGPFRGFKLSMGGKGSGSKGLTGVCCFDMIQDT